MRTIHSALTTAQRQRSRHPYLRIALNHRFVDQISLDWSDRYDGGEADGPHALATPDAGTANRWRVESNTCYHNRATSGGGWDFSAWTVFRNNTRLVAAARHNAYIDVYLVDNNTPTQIYRRTSSDGGATFGSASLVITHSETITHIAAARTATTVCVIVNDGSNIAAYRYASGWQPKVVSVTGITLTGLAIVHGPDWNCIATGTLTAAPNDRAVLAQIFGDGYRMPVATWQLQAYIDYLVTASTPSNIAFSYPFIAYPDAWRVTFREVYSGPGPYDRIMEATQPPLADFDYNTWREPIPTNITAPYGIALDWATGSPDAIVFRSTPNDFYWAILSDYELDLTPHVLSADIHQTSLHPATATVVIDNASGNYDPTQMEGQRLVKGAQLEIGPGYRCADGTDRYSDGPHYWLTNIEHVYEPPGAATVLLTAADAWSFLNRWTSPRTYRWPSADQTLLQLTCWLIARIGFELVTWGTSTAFARQPPFTIPAGTSALTTLRRILQRVPDLTLARGHLLYFWESDPTDAAQADYDWAPATPPTSMQILAARYNRALKDANHYRIFGGPDGDILGESLDFPEIAYCYASAAQRADPTLANATEAAARAAAEQRHQEINTNADRITAPVHCGLEVGDVVTITDPRLGYTDEKRRLTHLRLVYARQKRSTVYQHHITLGAP